MNAFIMMGTTLAGKTLHGKELAKRFGMDYVSSGDIARSMMDAATKAEFAEGRLSPHDKEIRSAIFAKMWNAHHHGRHIVLDGFPRTPWHVVHLLAQELPQKFVVINLDVSLPVIVERTIERKRDEFDTEAVVLKRNEVYEKETRPGLLFLSDHFGQRINVIVNYELEREEITKTIIERLGRRGLL